MSIFFHNIRCISIFAVLAFFATVYEQDVPGQISSDRQVNMLNTILEKDWLRQAELRFGTPVVQPDEDTIGAVDGDNVFPNTKKFDSGTFEKVLESTEKLEKHLHEAGVNTDSEKNRIGQMRENLENTKKSAGNVYESDYFEMRKIIRKLAFKAPELDFDSILFAKNAPSSFPHMSDQCLSFWGRGNGAICILKNFKSETPELVNLTKDWKNGTFFRPELSYDGKKVLFAYAVYHPDVALVQDKVDKANIAEENFFHLYEMEIESGKTRQLTFGKYDDFDGRYLPNNQIIFLSTRKGNKIQTGKFRMDEMVETDFPSSYVRCGGNNFRPVVVYTLHSLDPNCDDMSVAEIRQISAFESFEWTPTILNNGKIAYTRWDYIDRYAQHFVSVWEKNADGTKPTLVYGNYTVRPDIVMEPRAIPGSSKLVFVGAAHHSTFGGSLAMFDRNLGTEGDEPIQRLTPEVPFPESEKWEKHYYANPAPLSEDIFLVSWSDQQLPPHGFFTEEKENPSNSLGIYYYDRFGNLELLHRDDRISCVNPIPLQSRPVPPEFPSELDWNGPFQGEFVIRNIYDGLQEYGFTKESQCVKRVRIVAVLPKVQPNMNVPSLGPTGEEPGKFVLGTVPVESDGSARFAVPSNIPYFFQALDETGVVIQTMRTVTDLLPGEVSSCLGCHENREKAPPTDEMSPIALNREPSKLTPDPQGTFPLKYTELVQPVLDKNCVSCHAPGTDYADASRLDLTPNHSYATLMNYGNEMGLIEFFANPDIGNRALYRLGLNALTHNTTNSVSQLDSILFASQELVKNSNGALKDLAFERDFSIPGEATASQTKLLKILKGEEIPKIEAHKDLQLTDEDIYCIVVWMDTYAMRNGCYSTEQEKELINFREKIKEFYERRP